MDNIKSKRETDIPDETWNKIAKKWNKPVEQVKQKAWVVTRSIKGGWITEHTFMMFG